MTQTYLQVNLKLQLSPNNLSSVPSKSSASSQQSLPQRSSNSSVQRSIDEIHSLPKPNAQTRQNRTKKGLTSTAQCTTETPFLNKLKERKLRREQKNKPKKPKQKPYRDKRKVVEKSTPDRRVAKTATRRTLLHQNDTQISTSSASTIDEQGDECLCVICGVPYGNDDDIWIECEVCLTWYHTICVNIDKLHIPNEFTCNGCDN
jgi:hypothetical protein